MMFAREDGLAPISVRADTFLTSQDNSSSLLESDVHLSR